MLETQPDQSRGVVEAEGDLVITVPPVPHILSGSAKVDLLWEGNDKQEINIHNGLISRRAINDSKPP
jgi:hypothetical protein